MIDEPYTDRSPTSSAIIVFVAIFTLPVVLASWLITRALAGHEICWRQLLPRWAVAITTSVGSILIIYGLATTVAHVSHLQWRSATLVYVLTVIGSVLVAPLAVIATRQRIATQLRNGRIAPHRADSIRRAIVTAAQQDARARAQKGTRNRSSRSGQPVIGFSAQPPDHRTLLDRVLHPQIRTLQMYTDDKHATLPLSDASPSHHLVIGATGSGKTTLLTNMTRAALECGFRVAIIDFKGAQDEADKFVAAARCGSSTLAIRMWPGDPLDLWRGSPQAIADRVMGFLPPPAGGGSEYYRARLQRAINAVVVRTSAPPPRSADELITRIRNVLAYAEDEEDRSVLTTKEAGQPAHMGIADALGSYLEPLRRTGRESVSGGFSRSDTWDLPLVSIVSTSEPLIRLGAEE